MRNNADKKATDRQTDQCTDQHTDSFMPTTPSWVGIKTLYLFTMHVIKYNVYDSSTSIISISIPLKI